MAPSILCPARLCAHFWGVCGWWLHLGDERRGDACSIGLTSGPCCWAGGGSSPDAHRSPVGVEEPRGGSRCGEAPRCTRSARVEVVLREQRDGLHGLRLFLRISLSFTLSVDVINCADGMLCQQQSRKHQKMTQKQCRGRWACCTALPLLHGACTGTAAASPCFQRRAGAVLQRGAIKHRLGFWEVPCRVWHC